MGQYIGKGVVVSLHQKLVTVEVVIEFIRDCPFKGQKFQFVSWVVMFSLVESSRLAYVASLRAHLVLTRTARQNKEPSPKAGKESDAMSDAFQRLP